MKNYKTLEKPIIFIGTGRSGTSIISEIVCSHKDLAYVSNYSQKFPKSVYFNLIRHIFDNPLFRIKGHKRQLNKVSSINKFTFIPLEAYAMWDYLLDDHINFSRDYLLNVSLSDDRISFIRSYFNKMVKLQNKSRLVFKITGPSRITFLTQIFPDALFINLKRNYIPTIASFLKVPFWHTNGIDKLWWTGVFSDEEQKWAEDNKHNAALITAFQLKKINDITQFEVEKIKPKYYEIHYEDFVKDPALEIQNILNFSELSKMDVDYLLKGINIYNRNKRDTEYFSETELRAIKEIIA
jgi:hypothetical protein